MTLDGKPTNLYTPCRECGGVDFTTRMPDVPPFVPQIVCNKCKTRRDLY